MTQSLTFPFGTQPRPEVEDAITEPSKRKDGPVFISDILTAQNSLPMLLLHWWATEDRKD